MVTITTSYQGNLRCIAHHGPSGTVVSTDAPADNQGLGESFSPTDLVATALATCAMTTMGIVAKREGISVDGMTAEIVKHMVADPLRRIGSLPLVIRVPGEFTGDQRSLLEQTARNCPVAKSLGSDVELRIELRFEA